MSHPGNTVHARRARAITLGASAAALIVCGAWFLPSLACLLPPTWTGEADRLADALEIRAGMTVADVGAGRGAMAVALSRRVGAAGHVYATELSGSKLDRLRRRLSSAGPANVTVVAAGEQATNLPVACCDAIVMRAVYHHISNPPGFGASLRQSLRPGGRVAIIDFPPGTFWHLRRRPEGAPAKRGGHGVSVEQLTAEMRDAGFSRVQTRDRFAGAMYLAVFRAPDAPADADAAQPSERAR